MLDVVVFGSCMIDFISYVDRMPKAGETLHSISFDIGLGGKGANQCIAAARLGCKTAMIGKVGSDSYGDQYRKNFEADGVNTKFLEVAGEHSGIALIVASSDGQNQIVINANANQFLSIEDAVKAKPLLEKAKVLICQLETPLKATIYALEIFKGISILNGAPALQLPEEFLKIPTIFCVNEMEAAEMTGITIENQQNTEDAIKVLRRKGCKLVIITLGKLGAAFNDYGNSENIFHIPVQSPVDVVDTVGAGDAFIGALAYFIAKYPATSWKQKIAASLEIASHSVQFKGTQSSYINFPSINPETKPY